MDKKKKREKHVNGRVVAHVKVRKKNKKLARDETVE